MSLCDQFQQRPTFNPRTGRSITVGGPTYLQLVRECGQPPLEALLLPYSDTNLHGVIDGIYMTTNETRSASAEALLKTTPLIPNAIHIGCAAWHNFDLMLARQSEYGLIFDFNPENKKFIDATLAIIHHMATRAEFIDYMTRYLQTNPIHFSLKPGLSSIDEMMTNALLPGSWLYSEDNYEFIRNRVLDHRIIAITQDITHTAIFSQIAVILKIYGVVDTVYLSNINIFMELMGNREALDGTVRALIQPTTLIIDCPRKQVPSVPWEDIANPLEQQTLTGLNFLMHPEKLFLI